MASSVKSKENREIQNWLRDLLESNTSVKVGIIANPDKGKWNSRSRKMVRKSNGRTKLSPASLLDIANIHEFGSPKRNIPQRSFLRSTWDENREKLQTVYITLIKREMKNSTRSPESILRVQELMGTWLSTKVKKKFTSNNWPKLKDPTRRGRNKKGLATPLVDTGQLRASISYHVEVKS
jgi:phage gpG-like protein